MDSLGAVPMSVLFTLVSLEPSTMPDIHKRLYIHTCQINERYMSYPKKTVSWQRTWKAWLGSLEVACRVVGMNLQV